MVQALSPTNPTFGTGTVQDFAPSGYSVVGSLLWWATTFGTIARSGNNGRVTAPGSTGTGTVRATKALYTDDYGDGTVQILLNGDVNVLDSTASRTFSTGNNITGTGGAVEFTVNTKCYQRVRGASTFKYLIDQEDGYVFDLSGGGADLKFSVVNGDKLKVEQRSDGKADISLNGVFQYTSAGASADSWYYTFTCRAGDMASTYPLVKRPYFTGAGLTGVEEATTGFTVSTVDNTDPTGSIYIPTAGQLLRGTVIFKVSAADNVAVASVQLKINGTLVGSPVTSPTSGYYEFSRDTTLLANATNHTVSAIVIDTSGHSIETASVTFAVDNLAPGGSITAPTAAQAINSTFVFTASASDANSGVKNVKFFIDSVQENTDSASPYTLSKDTSLLSNASHTVYAIIEDNAGNTYQTPTITFTVFNATPPTAAFSVVNAEIGEKLALVNSSTGSPTSYMIAWGDGTTSNDVSAFHRYRIAGTFTITLTATNTAGSNSVSHDVVISDDLLPWENSELLLRIDRFSNSNGVTMTALADSSGKTRHLASSGGWTFQTNVLNGKPVVRGGGSTNVPFTHSDVFTIRCGWIVTKYNGASFDVYRGLLTALDDLGIFVGDHFAGDKFYEFPIDLFEFRSNDRIYPKDSRPGPVNEFKIIFFRCFTNFTFHGVSLGQDRSYTDRRWKGDIALMGLYSRDFLEGDIRKYSQKLATFYGLTLANVFPFLGEYDTPVDKDKVFLQSKANDNTKVVRLKTPSKQKGTAVFSERDQIEHQQADAIWEANYPETPVVLRDYGLIPPIDINAYFTSKITRTPKDRLIDYTFDFEEV